MKLEIDKQLVDALLSYLKTRPWNEVNNAVVALTQLKEPVKEEQHGKDVKQKDIN